MLLAVGAMTQTIIELELNQFFGKRRVKGMIGKLEGHVIVCGFGRVGRGAADELRQARIPFVVVDINEDKVERAMRAGMLGVLADASRDETLRECGIDRAKGLIATLGTDADNLFLILTAKTLNSRLQLSARVAEESSEEKMRRAGADFVIAPYNSTGHRMAQAIVRPHVQEFLDFTTRNIGLKVGIEQVEVGASLRLRRKEPGRNGGAARNRSDRAGDPQGLRRNAVQSAPRGQGHQRRSSHRHGRGSGICANWRMCSWEFPRDRPDRRAGARGRPPHH